MLFTVSVSCTDMDIPPKNIVGDGDIFGSEAGVMSHIARMYSTLPIEDYKYNIDNCGFFAGGTVYMQQSCRIGEAIGRDTRAGVEGGNWWDAPYSYIRDVNTFLEKLPEYAGNHQNSDVEHWLGEAYFIRAYIYFSLVKRYGGVPIVDKVIDYPASVSFENTMLFRDSEEDVWDFISDDLDRAYEMLPDANQKGRVTKSAAAAMKSRAMLYAGSIAKYNNGNGGDASLNYIGPLSGKQVMGIPAARAKDYFKQAYDASLLVSNAYGLKESSSSDRQAMVDNFAEIFLKDSKEVIFARYYDMENAYHQFENTAAPFQVRGGNNDSEVCPTLDLVEMYEFPNKDENGKFRNRDANGYLLFDSPKDAFAGCEPRLEATVILPMATFRGQEIDLRRGIWKGKSAATISPLMSDAENYSSDYPGTDPNTVANFVQTSSISGGNYTIDIGGGKTMLVGGKSGLAAAWDFGNISGFYLRKLLNPETVTSAKSTIPWVELRYAEVLLNRAEAAWELASFGESADDGGKNYLESATECVNMIRKRAGATLLSSTFAAKEADRDVIRAERRKELAFENKTYWDLNRWRVRYKEQNQTKYRTIAPIYSIVDGKYFIDIKYQESRGQGSAYVHTYNVRDYYKQIPMTEITRNRNCDQNDGY